MAPRRTLSLTPSVDPYGKKELLEFYSRQLEHFAECIAEDREPAISPAEARSAVAVALAIHRSLESGGPCAVGT